MTVEIRVADPSELDEVYALRYQILVEEEGLQNLAFYERFRSVRRIPDEDPGNTVNFVAIQNGRMVGAAALRMLPLENIPRQLGESYPLEMLQQHLGWMPGTATHVAELRYAVVAPEHRRSGVHRALLNAREMYFRRRGGNLLLTAVKEANLPSRRSLLRHGWSEFGRYEGRVAFVFFAKSLTS